MPKSKRAQKVTLSKTQKKTHDRKQNIIDEVTVFIGLLSVFVLAFAQCATVMFPDTLPYETFYQSVITLTQAMLGDVSPRVFVSDSYPYRGPMVVCVFLINFALHHMHVSVDCINSVNC